LTVPVAMGTSHVCVLRTREMQLGNHCERWHFLFSAQSP
jgi:hypothetical protein